MSDDVVDLTELEEKPITGAEDFYRKTHQFVMEMPEPHHDFHFWLKMSQIMFMFSFLTSTIALCLHYFWMPEA